MSRVTPKDAASKLGCSFCHSHATHFSWCPHYVSDSNPAGYPPPPHWPAVGLHQSEWAAAEAAGYDMRQFYLVKPIPKAITYPFGRP